MMGIFLPSLADWSFSPQAISPLSLVLILPAMLAIAITYLFPAKSQPPSAARWRRGSLLALRLTAILCVLLMLIHPVRTYDVQTRQRPVLAILLDDSRSMALPASADRATSRYDTAKSLAQSIERQLADRFDLEFYDVQGRPLAHNRPPDQPTQPDSPLSLAIGRIGHDLAKRPAVALMILSDGRETPLDDRDEAWASEASPSIPPVFPLLFVSPMPDRRPAISITSIAAATQAMLGGQVSMTVDMQSSGLWRSENENSASHQLVVSQGTAVLAMQPFAWPKDQTHHRETLRFSAKQAGQLSLTVQIKPLADRSDSFCDRQTISLHVRAKPLTVLYVDGVVRWEGKFLRQALSNDRNLQLITRVRSAPVGLPIHSNQPPLLSDRTLESVDVVILGDIDASQLSPHEIASLRRWVTRQGGGLAVTGGYRSFGPGGLGQSELASILPIDFSGDEHPQIEQPFTLRLTPTGQQSPIFHLTGLTERDTAFYQSLPMLEGCCRIAGVKPAAQVLAINPMASGPDGQPGLPVMVIQPVGLGRTLVLTADTTWRWRMVVTGFTGDGTFYERFWGQIVRALAPVPLANGAESGGLLTNTLASTYRLNQPAPLILTAAANVELSAIAIDESGHSQELILNRTEDGVHQANLPTHRAGAWNLLLTAKPAGQTITPKTPIVQKSLSWQVLPEDVESIDPQPDANFLERLAQQQSGQTISVDPTKDVKRFSDRLESLIRPLATPPIAVPQRRQWELWRHPFLVGLLLTCLCIEWIWRRQGRWL